MLRQASIAQLRQGHVNRNMGHIAICMAYYPRGVQRLLFDEFRSSLAPDRRLFHDWKSWERTAGHNHAFEKSNYEDRFGLSETGFEDLKRLSELAKSTDVFLVCQCVNGERCHREMLLLLASKLHAAPIEVPLNNYSRFLARPNYALKPPARKPEATT